MAELVPEGITKIKRSEFLTYLDTTPSTSATWKILGVGITDYAISYNPQVDTEKWIIEDNARTNHSSNQKQGSVSQTCYKNDDLFTFVQAGRDELNYKTHILDIDTWNGTGSGSSTTYPAKMSDGLVAITSYSGEKIEYDLYYDGDATEGTVTITNGVPTFTPSL